MSDLLMGHPVTRRRDPLIADGSPAVIASHPVLRPGASPPPPPPPELDDDDFDERPLRMEARVAPLWRRLAAWCCDLTAICSIGCLFFWAAAALARRDLPGPSWDVLTEPGRAGATLWLLGLLLVAALTLLYLALFTALGGETPGKQLLGLRVIDRWGQAPSAGRSVVRAGLAVGSGALALMGFFLVLFDRRRQALHDKLAGTFVVLRRSIVVANAPAVDSARAG
jgi:uncharacterized RDD family membrane protein YckC